jgi:hypothetical protein
VKNRASSSRLTSTRQDYIARTNYRCTLSEIVGMLAMKTNEYAGGGAGLLVAKLEMGRMNR